MFARVVNFSMKPGGLFNSCVSSRIITLIPLNFHSEFAIVFTVILLSKNPFYAIFHCVKSVLCSIKNVG